MLAFVAQASARGGYFFKIKPQRLKPAPLQTGKIMDTQNTPPLALEKDPVCGMTVDPSRAKGTYEHAGKTHYFCCRGCQQKFSADPAKYLQAKPAGVQLMDIAPASSKPMQIAPAPARSPQAPMETNAAVPVSRTVPKNS